MGKPGSGEARLPQVLQRPVLLHRSSNYRGVICRLTIFELQRLVQAANQKNRHLNLMARQCGICGRTRAQALRPLLTNLNLKVFSTLVMDAATARDLLK